jgi:hypothetical protein
MTDNTDDNIPTTYVAIDNFDHTQLSDYEARRLNEMIHDWITKAVYWDDPGWDAAVTGPLAVCVLTNLAEELSDTNSGPESGGSDGRGLQA